MNTPTKKSFLEHEVEVRSSSLELVDPTSLRFVELSPNPLPLDLEHV